MIELGNREHIARIEKACSLIFNFRSDVCISRSHDGKLLGGVIFDGFTGGSIQAHVAAFAPFWLNRRFLWMMFDYPFNQLGVGRVFCNIRGANAEALEFNLKLGFKEVVRLDGVFPHDECVITSMSRDECRWLNLQQRAQDGQLQERRS